MTLHTSDPSHLAALNSDASRTDAAQVPTTQLLASFEPKTIEAELYAYWESQNLFSPAPAAPADKSTGRFSLVIPPPNVTGVLHMGHALDNTLQDILVRWHRMRGDDTVWIPGTDHAGIATQTVVERQLQAEGKTRDDLGREAFLARVYDWSMQCKGSILGQLKRLGVSPDWQREAFTLDEARMLAVRQAFAELYKRGLIYRGEYIVNWCPQSVSAISDIEVEYREEQGMLYHLKYRLADGPAPEAAASDSVGPYLLVATTRPETIFGDVAVAVHPDDATLKHWIGKTVRVPLSHAPNASADESVGLIKVIADDAVELGFGTGALKITPAHDKNDFEIGQRHNLPRPVILDLYGRLANHPRVPQALQGVDRFEARKQVVAMLDDAGLLAEQTPHKHRVGYSQRHGSVIEPLLSKQWFVKTTPLAQAALESLKKGELRFIPERWTNDYTRWLENIQDWCISRQLWWGHQIPAWYAADDIYREFPIVNVDNPQEKPACCPRTGSTDLVPDPDVLDTWFSSGLWPMSTLNWPQKDAPDFHRFYPTSVLVTGFDIIFFWVARMTMMGLALTGQSPFETVYIHGLIRDEKGQKMSKSKGNTVDPVLAIDQYGCDGFRFGLTSLVTYGGQDIKLSPAKLEEGKLFANKLWNAARFVMMNLPQQAEPLNDTTLWALPAEALTPLDRWIMARYQETVVQATQDLAAYRFGEYAVGVQRFAWDAFCDWYVEMAKGQMRDPDTPERGATTQLVLRTVLDGLLRLLHPVMPFITEKLWQTLQAQWPVAYAERATHTASSIESISLVPFPGATTEWLAQHQAVAHQTQIVLEAVREIRHLRQNYKIPHATALEVIIVAPEAETLAALRDGERILRHFIRLERLMVTPALNEKPAQSAAGVVGSAQIFVPLAGLIDVALERARLEKVLTKAQAEHAQLEKLLGNAGFTQKATDAVIAEKQSQLSELATQVSNLQTQVQALA
ncbi:MAG: valine--tRNA ligase [Vampirovibrionales bacterium]|nr:valine--tRNA ligase [Vampirovibrionales bacterium]